MKIAELVNNIKQKQSFLSVGLDVDLQKIPKHLLEKADPIFEFNKAIIDATKPYCVSYKPNFAFYEAYGSKGITALEKTVKYIGNKHFIIADAKRGDIGNTCNMYAKAIFETMNCDAVTISPYMGFNSVEPFLQYQNKTVILLALTSNESSTDFQTKVLKTGNFVFEEVLQESSKWKNADRIMYVVGATNPTFFDKVRQNVPKSFLLIPGIGAQGGDLKTVCNKCLTNEIGILVASSRSIIYASNGLNFAEKAAEKAKEMQQQMSEVLIEKGLV